MTLDPSTLPAGACDCHTHVFLDPRLFPYSSLRRYTPPPADEEALLKWQGQLGLERVVIVQPSVYGDDHAALLHTLHAFGPLRARGVASLGPDTTDGDLDALHAAGVRGVRVNLEIHHASDARRATSDLLRAAERLAPRGWHVQIYANSRLLAECADVLAELPVPIVLDHFAGWRVADGDDGSMAPVLELLAAGRVWIKLSAAYRVSARGIDDPAVDAMARRLISANPARVVWGSDWPHPNPAPTAAADGLHVPFEVDLQDTLARLGTWCAGDASLLRQVLTKNPASLYDFER